MKTVFGLLMALLSAIVPLLVIGTVIGLLLKWLLNVEWGHAILIGVVSTGLSAQLVLYSLTSMALWKTSLLAQEVDEDEDDDELDNEYLAEVSIVPPKASQYRRRKAKR